MHLLSFKNSLTRCIELISSPRNGPDRSIHKNKTQSDSELQKSSKILEQFEQVTENAGECHRCGTLQLLGCKSTACRVTRTQCLRLQHNIERHLQYPSRWRLQQPQDSESEPDPVLATSVARRSPEALKPNSMVASGPSRAVTVGRTTRNQFTNTQVMPVIDL